MDVFRENNLKIKKTKNLSRVDLAKVMVDTPYLENPLDEDF
jgi:hypothetical protein